MASQPNSGPILFAPNAIQVRHARILEASVRANLAFPKPEPDQLPVLDIYPISISTAFGESQDAENQSMFSGRLTVALGEDTGHVPPYFFKIVVEGLFQCVVEPEGIEKPLLAAVHGSGILYAMAREIMANLTSRSLFGPVMLPGIVFGLNPADPVGAVMPIAAPKQEPLL